MRIVVFTGHPDIQRSAWWPIILGTPGLRGVLICKHSPPSGGAWRRFRANVRKHGLLWVPYRTGYAVVAAARRMVRRPGPPSLVPSPVPVEEIPSPDLARAETVARVRAWGPDLGVALGAPILKPVTFSLPARGTINLHLGKVPEFRGAPPGFWELMAGASEIGATVHWVDAGLDTGRVIVSAAAPIYERDSLRDVQGRAEELGRVVLARALRLVAAGPVEGAVQAEGGRTYRMPLLEQRLALWARLAGRRLARALTPRAMAKTAAEIVVLLILRPLRDMARTLRGSHPVRVFTFHRITRLCRDGMTVTPEVFARQIEYIRRTHEVVSLERALALVRRGGRLRRPVALLTFDDGYRSVVDLARPELSERGLVGVCFVPTALVGADGSLPHDRDNPVRALLPLMNWNEVERLHAAGWAIGCHSATHARLSAVSGDALRREVEGPAAALRERFGSGCLAIAYPYGGRADITAEARERIRLAGYDACFNDVCGENGVPADPFDLSRIELGGDHGTLAWKRLVHGISLDRWRSR